ncbi:MAG: type II toxin-antitoxin system prevent-host-death family antitoxin [Acidimicrobiales bacterium]|nr:type II toxin-antitoxin system prevent-host-death family antitoxin [Acidimicrobiales bacterium]
MDTVSHREMRNQSGEILRRVAQGESFQVTNHGVIAALIVPPETNMFEELVSKGQVRLATKPLSSLQSLKPHKSRISSEEVIADLRGKW